MNPANQHQAGREAEKLIANRLRKVSHSTKIRRIARARKIGEWIWKRFHVGIYRWQLKHVRWVLTNKISAMRNNTQYQYWLVVRFLIELSDNHHWIRSLNGPWLNPIAIFATKTR